MRDTSRHDLMQRSAAARAILQTDREHVSELQKREGVPDRFFGDAASGATLGAKHYSHIVEHAHQVILDSVVCRVGTHPEGLQIDVEIRALAKVSLSCLALHAASCAGIAILEQMEEKERGRFTLSLESVTSAGGRRDDPVPLSKRLSAGVIILSDSRAGGRAKDESGPAVRGRLEAIGIQVTDYTVIPDDAEKLQSLIRNYADQKKLDIVITSGGTGLGPRDIAPEVTAQLIEKAVPGVSEIIRQYGQRRTPFSMLSRATVGVRGKTLLLNLPGSPAGVGESLDAVLPELLHVFKMMEGGSHS